MPIQVTKVSFGDRQAVHVFHFGVVPEDVCMLLDPQPMKSRINGMNKRKAKNFCTAFIHPPENSCNFGLRERSVGWTTLPGSWPKSRVCCGFSGIYCFINRGFT
jgi:hypothetical protein